MADVLGIAGVHHRALDRPGVKSDAIHLALGADFTQASARELIAAIAEGTRLLFFDAEHPQRSDPGLYVSLQRCDGELYAKGANHGWSYPWVPISSALAARWLWLCRNANNGDDRYESSVLRLDTGYSLTVEPDAATHTRFNDWLARRLAD